MVVDTKGLVDAERGLVSRRIFVERELYEEARRVGERVRGLPYPEALAAIAGLRPRVDLFFDKVLVMAPEAALRENRLALLSDLSKAFSQIADLSQIVTTAG